MTRISYSLRRKEASLYLKDKYNISRTAGTLAKLAHQGSGPKFQYAGRVPMYPVDLLDEWATSLFSSVVGSTTAGRSLERSLNESKANYATNGEA